MGTVFLYHLKRYKKIKYLLLYAWNPLEKTVLQKYFFESWGLVTSGKDGQPNVMFSSGKGK